MKHINKVFKTNNYGDLVVTKYVNSYNVHVKFLETGYETISEFGAIRKGEVKDKLKPSVLGVGIIGDTNTRVNGKLLKEYRLWQDMLRRCYCTESHKTHQTYADCSVSDAFRYFPYFKEWCNKQIGFDQEGWNLDKDVLIKGNKTYSENTCVFVPREVNMLFVKSDKTRGNLMIGVSCEKNSKFVARVRKYSKVIRIGEFNTEIDAFNAYKVEKEAHIKDVANKWKGQIDKRVYQALLNYKVEITD